MTIFMIVAIALLVLGFFLRGGESSNIAYFTITPTDSYGDPSSYVEKKVLMEVTFNGSTIQGSGTVVNDNDVWAEIDDSDTNSIGFLYFEEGRLVFEAPGLTAGQELTIKVSIVEEDSGSGGGLVVHASDQTGTMDKTWQEIYDAMASGSHVVCVVDSEDTSFAQQVVGAWADHDTNWFVYAFLPNGSVSRYIADGPTGYPALPLD